MLTETRAHPSSLYIRCDTNNFNNTSILQLIFFFFGFEETSPPRKAYFVGPGEGVKPRLSQVLTRGARPDSNSRPAVHISNPLPSRYASWGLCNLHSNNIKWELPFFEVVTQYSPVI